MCEVVIDVWMYKVEWEFEVFINEILMSWVL